MGMDRNHLLDLRRREAQYWWHANKRVVVLQLLHRYGESGGKILEIGSGGGFLSTLLASRGWNVVAADLSPEAASFIRTWPAQPSLAVSPLVFDAGVSWPLAERTFDVVLMLDLLEHVNDDTECLKEARRILRGGGVVILTLPAHPALYCSWDRMAGHCRRYTKCALSGVVVASGLKVEYFTYWNAISLLPAVVLRGRERRFLPDTVNAEFPDIPGWLNTLLKGWGRVEGKCATVLKLPVGLSMAVVLRKDKA